MLTINEQKTIYANNHRQCHKINQMNRNSITIAQTWILSKTTSELRNCIEFVEVYEQSVGERDICLSNYNIFFQVATNDEDSAEDGI